MRPRSSLRRRIVWSSVAYIVVISLAVIIHGHIVNERAEHLLWESLLERELTHFVQRRRDDPGAAWRDTESLALFGASIGNPVPVEFRSFPPGVHDEIRRGQREYVVLVRGSAADQLVLALDITEIETREKSMTAAMALGAIALLLGLMVATYFATGRLMKPLSALTEAIRRLRPDTRHQQVTTDAGAPDEVAIIAEALNDFMRRTDSYVEREQSFLNTASHELRTPIAVISGAAEVAIDQPTMATARPHLARILSTARDMQQLVLFLLTLAKDPSRLSANAESVDLARLVSSLVADHAHLCVGREISIEYGPMPNVIVSIPAAATQAAIGNLLRNAIENSSRGTIRLSIELDGTIVIEDPGSGMSARELSSFYKRRAQAGERTGDGIGLDLIARLCQHLGWTLQLLPRAEGGTIARLSFKPAHPEQTSGQTSQVPVTREARYG
jgi:signal transduction histidine kinase